ncbi:MAG TPA: acyl-CoA dehydrogenase family protein [Fimbriimonadaceae bacterium]|jgi:alkylation response protein AidB-like acyl-CoA dehydrogenase
MYQLNTRQEEIVNQAGTIADNVIGPNAAAVDRESRFPTESMEALRSAGLLGLTVPAEHGGMGEPIRTGCAVLDEIAQRDASVAMIFLMHLCGLACYASNPEAAGQFLRDAAAGKHLTTLAFSERGSRSHFWAPVSQAQTKDGKVVINAEKSWVTSAGFADGYVVSSRSPGATGIVESTLYLVLKGDPGVAVDGAWDALGMRGNASAPVRLSDCTLDAGRALCEDGKGYEAMVNIALPVFQLGNAAVSIGIAEAAIGAVTRHLTAKKFEESNTKLADLPNLRARLAQMRIETDKARAHLASAVTALENPGPATMLMLLESKASASDAALKVTDLAMLACGGAAFSKHLTVERNFRDARAASVMAPTTDVIHDFIGRALCGMELF